MSKYSKLSQEEKYKLLTEDFLERDGDRFVRIRTTDRLGWEDTLPKDSAYSAAILNPKSERDLYMNAMTLARQMITSMDTPFRVQVRIDPTNSCTDSHSVFVATKVFDDPELSLGQKLDTFLGLTIHEGSHLLYSDFNEVAASKNIVIHQLSNIFEDERIERLLGENKPGLANFLKATKYYYFGRYKKNAEEIMLDRATRLFNAILCLVRYPASLKPVDATEFAEELLETRDILTPYPKSTKECNECAKKVYEILKKFIQKEQQEQQQQQQQQNSSSSRQNNDSKESGSSETSPSQKNSDKTDEKNKTNDNAKENTGASSQDGSEQNNKKQEKGEHNQDSSTENRQEQNQSNDGAKKGKSTCNGSEGTDNANNKSNEPQPLSDNEIRDILKEIIEAAKALCEDPNNGENGNPLKDEDTARALLQNDAVIAKECEGRLEIGHNPNTLIIKERPNKKNYEASKTRIRRYIPAVAAALKANGTEYKYNVTGMRNGILDTNKLAEAKQGVENIYMQKGEVKCDKISVALVIDESGSMSGIREQYARDITVLVNEAVGNLKGIELYIYGYTNGSNNSFIIPYREGNQSYDRYTMGSIQNRAGTPTDTAMTETAWRIRKQTNEKVLMFIISDGGANGGPGNVRMVTNRLQKDNMQIIGISISSSLTEQELQLMYDHYIDMHSMQNLAAELGKVIKKAILCNAKRH